VNTADLAELSRIVQTRAGLLLRGDKGYFVESRLAPLARRENTASVDELVQRLLTGTEERLTDAVCEALAVTDTAFFRDPEVFRHLREHTLPTLLESRPDGVIQVWCAGCATGQEAYSLAMLALEAVDRSPQLKLEIVATDLSQRALEKAHAGLYTQFEVQRGLPIRYLLRHFEKTDEMWSASSQLRSQIRWRRLNLMEARRSLRRFDLVLCRNVVGYLDTNARGVLLQQFAPALADDGVLVLGRDEAPPTGFEETQARLGVFRAADSRKRAAA
jgi:chemotaxis protein methyltransferase CheR